MAVADSANPGESASHGSSEHEEQHRGPQGAGAALPAVVAHPDQPDRAHRRRPDDAGLGAGQQHEPDDADGPDDHQPPRPHAGPPGEHQQAAHDQGQVGAGDGQQVGQPGGPEGLGEGGRHPGVVAVDQGRHQVARPDVVPVHRAADARPQRRRPAQERPGPLQQLRWTAAAEHPREVVGAGLGQASRQRHPRPEWQSGGAAIGDDQDGRPHPVPLAAPGDRDGADAVDDVVPEPAVPQDRVGGDHRLQPDHGLGVRQALHRAVLHAVGAQQGRQRHPDAGDHPRDPAQHLQSPTAALGEPHQGQGERYAEHPHRGGQGEHRAAPGDAGQHRGAQVDPGGLVDRGLVLREPVEQGLIDQASVAHSVACGARSASVFSPMPSTSSSSSTEENAPWAVRQSRIFWAVTGPTPGSVSSWSRVAVFRLTRAPVASGAAVLAPAARNPAPPRPGSAGGTGGRRPTHQDLLAVDQHAGQVERGQVDPAAGSPGAAQGVDDPGPGRQGGHTGAAHAARDVHGDRGPCTVRPLRPRPEPRPRACPRARDRDRRPGRAGHSGRARGDQRRGRAPAGHGWHRLGVTTHAQDHEGRGQHRECDQGHDQQHRTGLEADAPAQRLGDLVADPAREPLPRARSWRSQVPPHRRDRGGAQVDRRRCDLACSVPASGRSVPVPVPTASSGCSSTRLSPAWSSSRPSSSSRRRAAAATSSCDCLPMPRR